MTRTFAVIAIAVSTAVLAFAAPALGATPFTAGSGTGHDLAVGSDGVGHLVWIRADGGEDDVFYCRVPAGGSACDGESTGLEFGDGGAPVPDSFGTAQVFAPAPSKVVVVASCTQCGTTGGSTDRTFRWLSTNSGVDFTGPIEIGNDLMVSGQAGYLNAGDIALGVEATRFMAMDFPGIENGDFDLGDFPVSSSPAVVASGSEVVHALGNNTDTVRFAVFTDPAPAGITVAELNTPGNWNDLNALSGAEADNEETHLSSGGNGVLLSYLSTFSPGDARVGLRVFNSSTDTFGSPVYVQGSSAVDGNGLDFPHHSQDAGNRIHFVWRTLHDGGRLRYIRSDDGGATFSAPANLALRESFQDPLVEAGAAGTGFAAWRTTGSDIRIVPIDPQPEPAAPGAPGGPGGPGAGDPDPTVSGFGAADSTLTSGAGTTFTFSSSEAGRAVLSFHKRVKGLKVRQRGRRRCVPRTRARLRRLRRSAGSPAAYRRLVRRRRCKAWKKVGEIRRDVAAGRNEIVWNGRVAGRPLSPGLYQARLRITDAAGNVSRTERLRFRVRRGRR